MNVSTGRRHGKSRAGIARTLVGGAKTVPHIASLLATSDGSLRSAIYGMERDGQIRKAKPLVRRGQRWELTSSGRRNLADQPAALSPGVILPGQRLLILVDQGEGVNVDAWHAIAAESGAIVWAARLDGTTPLLVAIDPADHRAADQLRASLTSAGVRTVTGRVSDTFDAPSLTREIAGQVRALNA